ncbi:MAG: ABC transporter ATP-binding protein [Epsilonproteobacteria bacterium]|nr:ABC transporter ATP-binding protein [Campylobacterota bacterium]
MYENKDVLLSIKDLKVYYSTSKGIFKNSAGYIKAVDGVNLNIYRGQTLGLVGESGCGKTTLGKGILKLVKPFGGNIYFNIDGNSHDTINLHEKEFRSFRKQVQMIFQDPYASLNPRMTVRDIIAEPLICLGSMKSTNEIDKKVYEVAVMCNLHPEHLSRFPHAFSGGQRQRIAIARALVLNPSFIVCDEPVSALDVSTQANILNLLIKLKKDFGLTYLFIGHDLNVVAYISDIVAVMHIGKIMEIGTTDDIFNNPTHPYTRLLLRSVPDVDKENIKKLRMFSRAFSEKFTNSHGCNFRSRCEYAKEICNKTAPSLRTLNSKNEHFVACNFAEDVIVSEYFYKKKAV